MISHGGQTIQQLNDLDQTKEDVGGGRFLIDIIDFSSEFEPCFGAQFRAIRFFEQAILPTVCKGPP